MKSFWLEKDWTDVREGLEWILEPYIELDSWELEQSNLKIAFESWSQLYSRVSTSNFNLPKILFEILFRYFLSKILKILKSYQMPT